MFAGESNGIGLISSESHFESLIKENKLVLVSQGAGYDVMKLTHSHPYITPYSKIVLEELGQAFQMLTDTESFFTITSVTRTPEQQQSLRKRNRNATSGESSHSYGVSFDISYIRFNGKKGGNRDAQKKLEMILDEYQKSDKILFIKERNQSCYHVTVR
ncbi:M15 family metallopeptidase [Algoriphagus ratkowskyi]|uniref:M15 family metallopeptidase n=1 Tax=Algoriphagus ratkowskyi TaxID=57028 RepID=A0ABY3HSS5_9BACT|nr:M15 family metallopeptidase [Algoriphagus ratkowskyi]